MSIFSNTNFNAKVTHEYLVILNGARLNHAISVGQAKRPDSHRDEESFNI